MPDDDIPDDDDDNSERSDINNHSLSVEARNAVVFFDAIGECSGCGQIGEVNGYHYCEYCWDDLTE
jgi:hypothetical protein